MVTFDGAVFTITSTTNCVIDGIGVLEPYVAKVLDKTNLVQFRAIHGYDIVEANFPRHITFEAVLGKEGR